VPTHTDLVLDDSEVVPVENAPMLGPRGAPVTVVVFSDFQCPYCNRGRQIMNDLHAFWPDAVRIVWRNLPLPSHDHAPLAAEAALEARAQGGDAMFWRYHDLLFAHQDALVRSDLERYATRLGLDLVRFRRALDEGVHADLVRADRVLAERLGVDGTPAFFVNGTLVSGAQPLSVFEGLTQAIVERARTQGLTRTFYADMTRDPLPTPERESRRPSWATVHTITAPPTAPSQGPEGAPVVIQVYSDFQCPYCARVEPTLAALREHYGDRLRVVWRDYPLPSHSEALPAAEAAREVYAQRGNEAFWRFHDVLFAHQGDDGGLTRTALEGYAQALDIDVTRFRAALDDHRHLATIRADMQAITATGVRFGTPAFFINGHFMSGARPLAEFRARIDALLRQVPAS
jgi:protein-disulfide isomerase